MEHTYKPINLAATFLAALSLAAFAAEPAGIKPLGADGKPLNLDFEDGTLKDWAATGTAFDKQPIKGDVVSKRRNDMRSGHQGQYWVGSFEIDGDKPQGTLTSAPFKLTQPWASFLVGGGSTTATKVEIFVKEGPSERAAFVRGREGKTAAVSYGKAFPAARCMLVRSWVRGAPFRSLPTPSRGWGSPR